MSKRGGDIMKVYQRSYTRDIPEGARICKRKGGKFAEFQGYGKRTVTGKINDAGNKVLVKSTNWYIEFTHDKLHHIVKACDDEDLSRLLAANIQKALNFGSWSVPMSPELKSFFDALPKDVRGQLVEAKVLAAAGPDAGAVSLDELADKFEEYLKHEAECTSDEYVRSFRCGLMKVFNECNFKTWSDLDDTTVKKCLLRWRNGGKGIGKRRFNVFVQYLRQFAKWAVEIEEVDMVKPFQQLAKLRKQKEDRRRQRRPATVEEVQTLLKTVANSPVMRGGMDGKERSLLYRFFCETGLRLNEVRQLKVSSIVLDDPNMGPHIVIDETISKHRERDFQPIKPELAAALQSFIIQRGKLPGVRLFCGRYKALIGRFCSQVLKPDLQAAGIKYQNEKNEYLDTHSFRHTYISSLRSAPGQMRMFLARHSSEQMTQNYTHEDMTYKRQGLQYLPDYTQCQDNRKLG